MHICCLGFFCLSLDFFEHARMNAVHDVGAPKRPIPSWTKSVVECACADDLGLVRPKTSQLETSLMTCEIAFEVGRINRAKRIKLLHACRRTEHVEDEQFAGLPDGNPLR